MLRVLDLFSGIGGFSLGLERTQGFKTIAFCEIDPFCRRVLAKHWPGVSIYEDVRELTGDRLAADGIGVDVICGGFPCQDISVAGKGAGLAGERSGLWSEYARIIGEVRPAFVIVENVAALLSRGLGDVLGDLASIGYDAEWHCIPAAAVGAPHRRDRLWIVANPCRGRRGESNRGEIQQPRRTKTISASQAMADATCLHEGPGDTIAHQRQEQELRDRGGDRDVRHANGPRLAIWKGISGNAGSELSPAVGANWWSSEPDVGRVAHGVSARVDRLRSLGNAVIPQIPELIGKSILESLNR